MIGRVFGVEGTLTSLVMLGAPLAGGWMIEAAGPGPVFAGFGWATAAIGLLGLLFRAGAVGTKRRRSRRRAPKGITYRVRLRGRGGRSFLFARQLGRILSSRREYFIP